MRLLVSPCTHYMYDYYYNYTALRLDRWGCDNLSKKMDRVANTAHPAPIKMTTFHPNSEATCDPGTTNHTITTNVRVWNTVRHRQQHWA